MDTPQIYGLIAAIMKESEPLAKKRYNEQQKFNYRGIDDLYNELQPLFAKHGVFTAPEVLSTDPGTINTKAGNILQSVRIVYRFHFYAPDGSSVFADAVGEASDTLDKSSNKAASTAHKYALLQILMLPTKEKETDTATTDPTAAEVARLQALIIAEIPKISDPALRAQVIAEATNAQNTGKLDLQFCTAMCNKLNIAI